MTSVSVVIPTRNRAPQLKQAIDSVLGQSEQVKEILVIDDGSTDGTRELLASYGSKVRAFFQNQEGASAARNRGFREAAGEWIAFLDDDDVWLEKKIELQMALAKKNPELALIFCSDFTVDQQLNKLSERQVAPQNRGDVFERLFARNFIYTSCVIARRSAIEEAGYMDLALRFAHDWDLWLKIAARHPVDFVSEPMVLYRMSAECLSVEMSTAARLSEMETVVERARQLKPIPDDILKKARYELKRKWAAALLLEGQVRKAIPHALRLVVSHPASVDGYQLLAQAIIPRRARLWVKSLAVG